MKQGNDSFPPKRDSRQMIAFKRQMRLQVYLPLGLFVLLLAAIVAWFWVGGVGGAGVWADVGMITLLIPALFLGLIVLAIFIALAVLIGRLIGLIPDPADRVQSIIRRVERQTTRGVDLALRPLVGLSALWSALKAIGASLAAILGFK
jgi:uncharacterized membrane protein (UPF0182 family)